MNDLTIFNTNHWLISHRRNCIYPGYLMISSLEKVNDIHQLSVNALQEIGYVLRKTEELLMSAYTPYKVIIAKLGFSQGFSCHFHMLPISNNLLQKITAKSHTNSTNNEPDGVDALLFINREYCEKKLTKQEDKFLLKTVKSLKEQHKKLI